MKLTVQTRKRDNAKTRNIIARYRPITTDSWFSIRYFQSVRLSNVNLGTKKQELWNGTAQIKVLQCRKQFGVLWELRPLCILTVWQIHTDSMGKEKSLTSMFPKPPIINSCIEPMCLQSGQQKLHDTLSCSWRNSTAHWVWKIFKRCCNISWNNVVEFYAVSQTLGTKWCL